MLLVNLGLNICGVGCVLRLSQYEGCRKAIGCCAPVSANHNCCLMSSSCTPNSCFVYSTCKQRILAIYTELVTLSWRGVACLGKKIYKLFMASLLLLIMCCLIKLLLYEGELPDLTIQQCFYWVGVFVFVF